MGTLSLELPTGFYLENDPDLLTLRRRGDDSMVAAFSALGATSGAVRQAAEEACEGRIGAPPRRVLSACGRDFLAGSSCCAMERRWCP
jgi:hypothetical protein